MDEAAMQQAASAATASAATTAASTPAATTEERIQNVLLASEEEESARKAELDDVPFEVATPEPEGASETAHAAATATEPETPAEPETAVEDVPLEVQPPHAEEKAAAEDDVEFEVKEVQKEETLTEEQLQDLVEEFGEEYDPTLDLGRFQLPNVDKLVDHGDGANRVTDEELQQNKENILRTLANFKIEVSKITAEVGPTVTLYLSLIHI